MRKHIHNYFKLGILVFTISLLFFSCTKDELFELEKTANIRQVPNLEAVIIKGDSILLGNSALQKNVQKYIKTTAINGKTVHSATYNFSIDTTFVQQIQTSSYTSYTFKVVRETQTANILENYVYTTYTDGHNLQYLISYPIIYVDDTEIIDINTATISNINDDDLIYKNGGCVSIVEYEDPICVDVPCASGRHTVVQGDQCDYWGSSSMATINCTGGGWVNQGCENDTNNGGGIYDPSNTTNGGNSNTNTQSDPNEPDEDLVVLPLFDLNAIDPCPQMKGIAESAQLRELFTTLKQAAANTTIKREVGYLLKKQSNGTYTGPLVQGFDNEIGISIRLNQGDQIDIFAHTHYQGLLSIFSSGDLKMYHGLLSGGASQHGEELVFIVVTQHGTKYAMRISNLTKFNTFAEEYLADAEKFEKLKRDHFENKIEDNNSVADNEKAFLQMMVATDIGMTLFESNDDFTEWKKLSLNGDTVVKQSCN